MLASAPLEGVIGDQGGLSRPHLQNQIHIVRFQRISLHIQLGAQGLTQRPNIVGAYMTGIWTGMHGDSIGPIAVAIQGKLDRIGHTMVPAVSQQRYFVDINAEAGQSEKLSPQAQDRAALGLLK